MLEQPICPICHTKKKLLLPIGGKGPRTYQCLVCDKDDPLNKPVVMGWLTSPGLKKPRKR